MLPSDNNHSTEATHDLLERLPWLRRLPTQQDLKQLKFESSWNPEAAKMLEALVTRLKDLQAAAKADDHILFHPTHIAERGPEKEILGYATIGAIPLVNVWFDSKRVKGRESATLMNMVENEAQRAGHHTICVPCWASSPLRPMIEKGLGYSYFGEAGLFLKTLR
jgi:hypothetical protein